MARVEEIVAIRWEEWIKELRHRVMYLYPPPIDFKDMREIVSKGVRSRFLKEVQLHTQAYLLEAKEPPAQIAPAIKNFADDIAAGREVVVRAGDYIAIQSYLKSKRG